MQDDTVRQTAIINVSAVIFLNIFFHPEVLLCAPAEDFCLYNIMRQFRIYGTNSRRILCKRDKFHLSFQFLDIFSLIKEL